MQKVRIIEIKPMKAAYSGPLTDGEKFEAFNKWFSGFHSSLKCELAPRDFMWYNERIGAREWFYALPENTDPSAIPGFEITDLPCGLFAVASCLDADIDRAEDWLKTREELIEWAEKSEKFIPYQNGEGRPERYPMFRIVSPPSMFAEGISIEDMYFPIEYRTQEK